MTNLKRICVTLALAGLFCAGAPARSNKVVTDDTIHDTVIRKLAGDSVVKGAAFDVEVKQGVVTLRGKVETEKQKAKAERLTKKLDGVKSVSNELQVVHR